jgi:hypothetical protein
VHGYVGNKAAVFPLQLLGFDVDPVYTVQVGVRKLPVECSASVACRIVRQLGFRSESLVRVQVVYCITAAVHDTGHCVSLWLCGPQSSSIPAAAARV